MKRNGIDPAPERRKTTSWSTFLGAHWVTIAAIDFTTVDWKDGTVTQFELGGGSSVSATAVRTFDVGRQVEGCVADDVHQSFYVGEEEVGVWKYDAEPTAGSSRSQVDRVGSATGLKDDAEGLAVYYRSDGGYLIVSGQSEGPDVRYVVYESTGNNRWLGTFRLQGMDATDGLDVTNFPLGAGFPHGMLVTHDNAPEPSRPALGFIKAGRMAAAEAVILVPIGVILGLRSLESTKHFPLRATTVPPIFGS